MYIILNHHNYCEFGALVYVIGKQIRFRERLRVEVLPWKLSIIGSFLRSPGRQAVSIDFAYSLT